LQPIKILNIKAGVSKIKYIGNGQFCVIDENNTVRIFDIDGFKLADGFKIKLPKNNPAENSVDISENGKYLAIGIRGKHKTTVWSVKDKKLLYTLGWHKGDVLSVKFDREEKYLMTGGEDGRSYIWSMATGKMVSSLPPHADYVLSCDFSKNCLWAATGSYDKSVTITNISSMDLSYRKRVHRGAVTFLEFLAKQRLISGDKTGELAVWNYAKGKLEKRLPGMIDMILDIAVNVEGNYMFAICNGNNKVSLYDLEKYEEISNEFIKLLATPSVIEFIPEINTLAIGTFDGSIYLYDLYEDEKNLQKYLTENDYEKAYELVSQNPFLKNSQVYQLLEEKWNKTILKAQHLLEKGEKDIANQLLSPFLKVPQKRAFVQSILKDFSEFEKFKIAVEKKKYPLAYSLVSQYPFLKNTVYYQKMEDDWKKTFQKARALIFKRGMDEEVRNLLKPFRGVTEKTPLIQSLFNEKQIYALLSQKLAKRDFKDFFILVNRFPYLTDLDEYKKAIEFGEKLVKKAQELLKQGQYKQVIDIAEMLKDFPMYKEEADELEEKAKILLEFHRILATKDLKLIDKFVKEHPFLEDVNDYQILEKEWREKLEQAEIYASKGDIENILESLKDYIDIEDKRIKIGQLIRSAYLQQILSLLAKRFKGEKIEDILFENAFKNYIRLFGFDIEISDLIEKAKKLKININISGVSEGDLTKWHRYKLPAKIWENLESK
jgi:WD40 repeat protein